MVSRPTAPGSIKDILVKHDAGNRAALGPRPEG